MYLSRLEIRSYNGELKISQMQNRSGVERWSLQDRRSPGGRFRFDELHRSEELSDRKLRRLFRRQRNRAIVVHGSWKSRKKSGSHQSGRIYYSGRSGEKQSRQSNPRDWTHRKNERTINETATLREKVDTATPRKAISFRRVTVRIRHKRAETSHKTHGFEDNEKGSAKGRTESLSQWRHWKVERNLWQRDGTLICLKGKSTLIDDSYWLTRQDA